MSDHKDAFYFQDARHPEGEEKAKGPAYRDLRNWKAGYLAALTGGSLRPELAADVFLVDFNNKREELLNRAQ